LQLKIQEIKNKKVPGPLLLYFSVNLSRKVIPYVHITPALNVCHHGFKSSIAVKTQLSF